MDGSEEVVVSRVVSGCDSSEVFEFAEEALDCDTLALVSLAEWEGFDAVGHGADVGPRAAFCHGGAHCVAVVGTVSEQDVPGLGGGEGIGQVTSTGAKQDGMGALLASWRSQA